MVVPIKYRKKPVEVEAMQWDGTALGGLEVVQWMALNDSMATYMAAQPEGESDGFTIPGCPAQIYLETLEGTMAATEGDYIIRGVAGEFYPCNPDIFHKTYELVNA